jgi:membrane protein
MDRLRALGERWPWLGRALDAQKRFGEVNGGSISSSITLAVFLALFPLMLVAIAVLGFIASDDPGVADTIIEELSLQDDAAETVRTAIDTARDSRATASILGFGGLVWAGLGLTAAIALGVQTPWQVKTAGLRRRLDGLLWLIGGVVLFSGALALGSLLNFLPEAVPKVLTSAGIIVAGLLVEFAFFLWTLWILGNRRMPWRDLVPGAVLGAIGFEALKLIGTVYVPALVTRSSSLYGPLGIVFAILAWLAFFARLVVYSSTLNAVLHERRAGVVTLEIQAPRMAGEVPVETNRGGAVVNRPAGEPG